MSSLIDMNTFNGLKESTGADFIGELVDTFLEDAPSLIQQMREALARRDADAFRRAAHSMKSNAATFGAMQLSLLAKELESMGRGNNLDIGNKLEVMSDMFARVETELRKMK